MSKLLINDQNKLLVGSNGKAYAVGNVDVLKGSTSPVDFTAAAGRILRFMRYGKCEQASTPTPSAPVDIVCNNGVIKARRQSGLPLGYQMVEWLKSTGSIVITGFKTKSTQELETVFYRERSGASYLYSSDTNTSGTTNTTAYLTSGAGNWRWDGKSYSIGVSVGIKFTSIHNKDGVWLNGTRYGYYTNAGEFISTNDLRLSSGENTTVRIYSMTIREGDTVTLDLVPVQRLSDSAYGFYDKVSGNFYGNSEATFTAGDPIDDPVEIYTDGTPEALTVGGINLFDDTNGKKNKWTQANGEEFTAAYGYISPMVKATGSTYTLYYYGAVPYSYSIIEYAADGSFIQRDHTTTMSSAYTVTLQANTAFVVAQVACNTNTTLTEEMLASYKVMLVRGGSPATAFEPYVTPQTASVPTLLGVGDYKDEQNIISGLLTHKVGIKVLDGTEGWIGFTSNTVVVQNATSAWGAVAGVGGYCTHLTVLKAGETTFAGACRFATAFNVYEYKTAFGVANVADFKAWLAEQYAAGTPVIVIYPLATPTTESIAPQPLNTGAGTNTLTDTAAVSNPEYNVTYKTQ